MTIMPAQRAYTHTQKLKLHNRKQLRGVMLAELSKRPKTYVDEIRKSERLAERARCKEKMASKAPAKRKPAAKKATPKKSVQKRTPPLPRPQRTRRPPITTGHRIIPSAPLRRPAAANRTSPRKALTTIQLRQAALQRASADVEMEMRALMREAAGVADTERRAVIVHKIVGYFGEPGSRRRAKVISQRMKQMGY